MPLQQTSGNVTADAYGGGVALKPNYIEDVFSTYLYTGNGSTQTITNGIDLAGKGGLVWLKDRTLAQNNGLYDTVRGATNLLISNQTNAQQTLAQSITSFTSSGFSVGTFPEANQNTDRFASWSFAKAPKFFDVVTYTGNGTTSQSILHSLGSVPGCIIIKPKNLTDNWYVYHRSTGSSQSTFLNLTNSADVAGVQFGSADPTSAAFTVGYSSGDGGPNINNRPYVAYVFAHNAGGFGLTGTDNVISCGSYTGNGSTSGPIVNIGYEPQWLMVKNASGVGSWYLVDNMRGITADGDIQTLYANLSNAEATSTAALAVNATGFQPKTTSSALNGSGSTYIYIAIRRGPMKVPTDATKVFIPTTMTGNTTVTTNFPVDLIIDGIRNTAGVGGAFYDRLRGSSQTSMQVLFPYSTSAETNYTNGFGLDNNTGYIDNGVYGSTIQSVQWNMRRAPNTFDEVCWTGIGTATTQTHNLGVVPELIITKTRSAGSQNWATYVGSLGPTKFLALDLTLASTTDSGIRWNGTAPTSSVFSIGTGNNVNQSGTTYVAYLFATAAGVSKVGSYTGTGATQTINCGFGASGSRFILIKRVDSTGDWYMLDSARGLTSGSSPYLLLNSPAAEVTGNNGCYASSGGFTLTSSASATMNINGASYIFLSYA